MSAQDEKRREALDVLKKKFFINLARRVNEMREIVKHLEASVEEEQDLQDLQKHAHAIAGVGATFGYPEITVAAREIDCRFSEGAWDEREIIALSYQLFLSTDNVLQNSSEQ